MLEAHQIAALFDRHASGLSIYAAQWTELADDCVQEAFCDLARQTNAIHSPSAWLFRAVRNRALNSIRGESRRKRRERLAAKFDERPDTATDTLNRMAVAEALDSLPDDLREIVVLRIWSSLTLSEIAHTLNSTPNEYGTLSTTTVHRRYQTALEQLKSHFELPCLTKNHSPKNS